MAQATSVFGDGRSGPGRAPSLPPAGASATRHIIGVATVSRGRPGPSAEISIERRSPSSDPLVGGVASGVWALHPQHPELLLECARDRD